MLKVFVSSTTRDLQGYRDFAIRFIQGLDLAADAEELWGTHGVQPRAEIEKRLSACDVYLGILAWRYGSLVPATADGSRVGGGQVSFTELEYRVAEKMKMPRLVLMAHPESSWLIPDVDVDRHPIQEFRKAVEGQLHVKYFHDLTDFCLALSKSLVGVLRESQGYVALTEGDKLLLEISNLMGQDLTTREAEMAGTQPIGEHHWFIPEIGRCNLGGRYILRGQAQEEFSNWLVHRNTPAYLLVGSSGIGKTNFLVDEIRYFIRSKVPQTVGSARTAGTAGGAGAGPGFRPVLFFPLGLYSPDTPLGGNLAEYLLSRAPSALAFSHANLAETLADRIRTGEVLLFLDGLDELARQKGQEACVKMVRELRDFGESRAVVMTCRDHIYRRLKRLDLFDHQFTVKPLRALTDDELNVALTERFTPSHVAYNTMHDPASALRRLARHPLLLELLSQIPCSAWRRLSRNPQPALLYDLWFDEVGRIAAYGEVLDFGDLAKRLARLMLEFRSDVLPAQVLSDDTRLSPILKLRLRRDDDRQSIFVEQTKDEWGFVHDSFREYSLAKTIESEFRAEDYQLLAETASLDYVGAETFRFLQELLPPDQMLLERILRALDQSPETPRRAWNNLVQNFAEVVGMMAINDFKGFIAKTAELLTGDAQLTNQTKYNLVRCLERLHETARRPYWQYALEMDWKLHPSARVFGAAAVRGFHLAQPRLGFLPPIDFNPAPRVDAEQQTLVSDALVSLLERHAGLPAANDGLLEVNCSHALIRWLHPTHVERILRLQKKLSSESQGNLFHAFLKLHEGDRASTVSLFGHCAQFFDGMYLHLVGSEFGRPELGEFQAHDVVLFESRHWAFRFTNAAFPNPRALPLSEYRPSYSYQPES